MAPSDSQSLLLYGKRLVASLSRVAPKRPQWPTRRSVGMTHLPLSTSPQGHMHMPKAHRHKHAPALADTRVQARARAQICTHAGAPKHHTMQWSCAPEPHAHAQCMHAQTHAPTLADARVQARARAQMCTRSHTCRGTQTSHDAMEVFLCLVFLFGAYWGFSDAQETSR